MDLGEPIARGSTAEIYRWGDRAILKLFHAWMPEGAANYEAQITQAIREAGLPAPSVLDLTQVDGRDGILFERVEGPTMAQSASARPWRLLGYARQLGTLHASTHERSVVGLPSHRERVASFIERADALPERVRAEALHRLGAMAGGDRVCHGDFHPGNVLVTAGGPLVIDWMDAARGDPAADVARTLLLILVATPPRGDPGRLALLVARGAIRRAYVRSYRMARLLDEDAVSRWLPILAAARLAEPTQGEERRLLEIAASAPGEVAW